MKTKDLGDCVRPIIFENEDCEEFLYSVGGTSFLVTFRDKIFAITAKHVLQNQNYEPKDVRIPISVPDIDYFLPLSKSYGNLLYEADEKDYADMFLFEVSKKKLQAGWDVLLKPYMFEENEGKSLAFWKGAKLLVKGYPIGIPDQNYVDYLYCPTSIVLCNIL